MKPAIFLISTLFLFATFSCNKNKAIQITDYRDNYVGNYNCLLRSKQTSFYGLDSTYTYDTTYYTVVNVIIGSSADGLTINGVNVVLHDKKTFSETRFKGYFHGKDSLYIDNSHPTGVLYSNIYRGQKIKS